MAGNALYSQFDVDPSGLTCFAVIGNPRIYMSVPTCGGREKPHLELRGQGTEKWQNASGDPEEYFRLFPACTGAPAHVWNLRKSG